jgi:hypothetical protein
MAVLLPLLKTLKTLTTLTTLVTLVTLLTTLTIDDLQLVPADHLLRWKWKAPPGDCQG